MKANQLGVARKVILFILGTIWILYYKPASCGWTGLVWWITQMVFFAIRTPYVFQNSSNEVTDQRKIHGDRFVLWSIIASCFFLPLGQVLFGIFSFADYTIPVWASMLGVFLSVLGLWLFWRSHADLDSNWSPVVLVHSEQKLVTNGVYKYIRHPMYLSFIIFFLAQPLLIHNWIAGALAPVSVLVLYVLRVREEERLMRDTFGAEYDDYCSETGSLLPKLSVYGSV